MKKFVLMLSLLLALALPTSRSLALEFPPIPESAMLLTIGGGVCEINDKEVSFYGMFYDLDFDPSTVEVIYTYLSDDNTLIAVFNINAKQDLASVYYLTPKGVIFYDDPDKAPTGCDVVRALDKYKTMVF